LGPVIFDQVKLFKDEFIFEINYVCRYEKRAECLKKSYSSSHTRHGTYRGRIVQLNVDGENTFDDNLCDIEHRAVHWFNAVPVSVRTGILAAVKTKLRKWVRQNVPIDFG
jgi:hypothetical protein